MFAIKIYFMQKSGSHLKKDFITMVSQNIYNTGIILTENIYIAGFSGLCTVEKYVSIDMRFPTMWYVRPAKPQISMPMSLDHYMTVKLLIGHYLKFLSLTGGYIGSSESTLFKMPICWKSQCKVSTQRDGIMLHSCHDVTFL